MKYRHMIYSIILMVLVMSAYIGPVSAAIPLGVSPGVYTYDKQEYLYTSGAPSQRVYHAFVFDMPRDTVVGPDVSVPFYMSSEFSRFNLTWVHTSGAFYNDDTFDKTWVYEGWSYFDEKPNDSIDPYYDNVDGTDYASLNGYKLNYMPLYLTTCSVICTQSLDYLEREAEIHSKTINLPIDYVDQYERYYDEEQGRYKLRLIDKIENIYRDLTNTQWEGLIDTYNREGYDMHENQRGIISESCSIGNLNGSSYQNYIIASCQAEVNPLHKYYDVKQPTLIPFQDPYRTTPSEDYNGSLIWPDAYPQKYYEKGTVFDEIYGHLTGNDAVYTEAYNEYYVINMSVIPSEQVMRNGEMVWEYDINVGEAGTADAEDLTRYEPDEERKKERQEKYRILLDELDEMDTFMSYFTGAMELMFSVVLVLLYLIQIGILFTLMFMWIPGIFKAIKEHIHTLRSLVRYKDKTEV